MRKLSCLFASILGAFLFVSPVYAQNGNGNGPPPKNYFNGQVMSGGSNQGFALENTPVGLCLAADGIGDGDGSIACGNSNGTVVASPQFQLPYYYVSGTVANVKGDTKATTDGNGTYKLTANITQLSPVVDIRANGAVIDGVTDIGPSIATSQAQCNVTNANSCTILMPCGGPQGCYWANGTDGVTLANGVTLMLQGKLTTQTTLVTPNVNVNIIGNDAGGTGVSFAAPNQLGTISVPSTLNGVLGTAVTVTPTGSNFGVTQAFTPSTMSGLYAKTWITIAGPLTCNITSLTRVSNLVTATLPSSCHIPPGVPLTIAGVADSTFNGAYSGAGFGPFTMLTSDYIQNTMSWKQSGQTDATSTGGTVTGLNEDTVENVQLSSCTSTTCTATFYRNHAATDLWGVDGVAMDAGANGSHAQLLKGISITAPGTALDAGGYNSQFNYISTNDVGQCSRNYYNFPVSVIGSTFLRFDSDAFNSVCGPWAVREWNQYNYQFASAGPIYITNSFITRGVKLDHGGSSVSIKNSTCDQCWSAVSFDPNWYWNGNLNNVSLDNVTFNDNPDGFPVTGLYKLYTVGIKADPPLGSMFGKIKDVQGAIQNSANDYYTESFIANDSMQDNTPLSTSTIASRGIAGTYNDGKLMDGEYRGSGANFSPSIIPHATKSITTNPSSWTGNCSVTAGVLAPDGTMNAGALTQNTGNFIGVGSVSGLTPAVGDRILFGAWVYTPTLGQKAQPSGISNVFIETQGSSHYSFDYYVTGGDSQAGGNDSGITNDWWHPVVGLATITQSDGTGGQILNLRLGCDTVKVMEYFDPWLMYIPATENIPLSELARWRTQLMHGYVPSNTAAGVLVRDPNLVPLNSLFTVATLPTCSASLKGGTEQVTDATSPTFLGTLTGGGAVNVPVMCNGTSWVPY